MSGTIDLTAPFDGIAVPLTAVCDPVFAGLMMGDGVAIEPLSSTLLAPCNGVVTHLARTGHALTLSTANGAEVLIHIGIDSVRLNGEGFAAHVRQGNTVRCGQALIEVDIDAVARRVPSLQTMVVIAGAGYRLSARASGLLQAGKTRLLSITPGEMPAAIGSAATDAAQSGPEIHRQAKVRHRNGLHARPAALVQASVRMYAAEIVVEFGGRQANARSVTALMGLGVDEGADVIISARGADGAAAAEAVAEAMQTAGATAHASGHGPAATALPPQTAAANLGTSADTSADLIGWRGVCAAPGLALGRVVRLDQSVAQVPEHGAGVDAEFAALAGALHQVRLELGQAVRDAEERRAGAEGEIFAAHLALADDPELIAAAESAILQGQGAGFAFRSAITRQCEILLGLNNALLAERVADMKDLERRLLAALGHTAGSGDALAEFTDGGDAAIVVADDLTPSELTRLPRDRVAGLATALGGATSHVAILARALGIPALVAVGPRLLGLEAGREILLDASQGVLEPNPLAAQLDAARLRIAENRRHREQMLESGSLPALTLDGAVIEVAANIVDAADAREAVRHGADGVGLLRTELLFSERSEMPSAAEQQQACQAVLDALAGRAAIIRTLDVGGDKEVAYLSLPHEDNPALGLRGIRGGFAQPAVLDTQLRALLSLQPLSLVRILIPMVSDVEEILRVRRRIGQLAGEMQLADRPQLGVMIEVPAAALLADHLARHVDFFSIGTNDLTQYALAMDRCHAGLAARLDPMHPALLRLIAMTVAGAAQHGKWVGMCGGMASDPEAVPVLLGLGVTELSVSPPLVPEIKARLRQLSQAQCRAEVPALLQLDSAEAVRAAARRCWPQHPSE